MSEPELVWKLNCVYFLEGSVPVCYFCKHWSLKLHCLSLLFDFVDLFISPLCLNF